jgi:hypothetical protein
MQRALASPVLLISIIVIMLASGTASAGMETFRFDVPEPELRTSGEHVYFTIQGFGSSTNPYYPVLPTAKVRFEIPYAATDISVSVVPGAEQVLGRYPDYLMRTPPLRLGDPDYRPQQTAEELPAIVPAETYYYMGDRDLRGHRVIEVLLYPIQYRSVDHEITYISSYSIDVTYSMMVDVQASEELALRSRSKSFEPLAAQMIENYTEINPESAGEPTGVLYDLSNPQYAIITTSTFEAYAESLAAWKTKKGVPTEVYLLSWIESNFTGYDTQEKIRNFLRLDSSTPKFDYVLLLGDSNTIPDRKCWSYDGDQVPCDYYYSDVVDGSYGAGYDWDTDNDHVWGEFDDVITWAPDIYVGRIASRTASEVETIIENILDYEKNPPTGSWPKKVVSGAAFANFPEPGYDPTDMAAVFEHVRSDFLDPAGVTYDRLYEAGGIYTTSYTYDYPVTATNFETRVGLGCGLAFPSGHGNYYGNYRLTWAWDDGDGYYDDGEGQWFDLCTEDYNPSTGGEKPYVLVGACLAGEFDRTSPCLGDFIVANWGIGAVASSRTSYYCVGWDDPDWPWNQGQEYRWWEEIWANGKTHLGQIHGDNKYNYATDFNTLYDGDYGPDVDYASRKNMFSSNLFGDPECPVWTDSPASMAVVHNSTLPTGSSPFNVTVTAGGPLEGATVCLWKGTEVYLVDDTNSSVVASFTPDPSTTGTMYVTVTKHNYIPYEGSATVQGGDTEAPEVTVTDPNGGEDFPAESFFDVQWIATDNVGVTSIDILLSTDSGASYPDTIATGEANDGIYSWYVDVPPTTTARIKVIAYDAAGNAGEDESDGDFTISDGEAPEVTVTVPNGGETWDIGLAYDITWTATDNIGVTSITIVYSDDGGATYPDTIATGEANDGVHSWLVDVDATTTARIKVIAYDDGANEGEDISDADFEIYDPLSGVVGEPEIPDRLVIAGASPNPFGDMTSIRFGIPEAGRVRIGMYDVSGRLVAEIADRQYPAGYHSIDWTNNGSIGTGLYFLRCRFDREEISHKVVISR